MKQYKYWIHETNNKLTLKLCPVCKSKNIYTDAFDDLNCRDCNSGPFLKWRPGAFISDIVFLMQSCGYDCNPNNYVQVFNFILPQEERKAILNAITSQEK